MPRTYTALETRRLSLAAAAHQQLHQGPGRRRVRADLRVLPRQVRARRGAGRGRVLHADVDRAADRRDHRAVPWADLRPGVRVGRDVRAVGALRRAPPALSGRGAVDLRAGEDRRDRAPGEDEPRDARALGRDPRGQQLLRGPARERWTVRLRDGESAIQRRSHRQGQARGRSALSRPPAGRQRQLPLDPAVRDRAQRHRAAPAS